MHAFNDPRACAILQLFLLFTPFISFSVKLASALLLNSSKENPTSTFQGQISYQDLDQVSKKIG